jgi:sulfonate transport system substrate-binding protein
MIRLVLAGALLFGSFELAAAQTTLRVGDQKGNSQAVMEAAGVLKDVPYKIEWKEFPAAAPLLESLSAGAIETGLVGDAPFTFAAAGCRAQKSGSRRSMTAWSRTSRARSICISAGV